MRIAFTSCQDTVADLTQRAWTVLAAQNPDHIVLLGDNIYMDYKFDSGHLSPRQVRQLTLPAFSALMHQRYADQWTVASFQQAIRAPGVTVHAIWDDHDFAWNNACAVGQRDKAWVSPEHRRLSRALFQQYRDALRNPPPRYPANTWADGVVPHDLGGIQTMVDLAPNVRLHLLDGRSFRESRGGIFHRMFGAVDAQMLGEAQRQALAGQWLSKPGINLLTSGTTLKDWGKYVDLAWLKAQAANHRIIVLSGDVHHPDFKTETGITELTASALAKPPGPTKLIKRKTEVFGLIDIQGAAMEATFWHEGQVLTQHTL